MAKFLEYEFRQALKENKKACKELKRNLLKHSKIVNDEMLVYCDYSFSDLQIQYIFTSLFPDKIFMGVSWECYNLILKIKFRDDKC